MRCQWQRDGDGMVCERCGRVVNQYRPRLKATCHGSPDGPGIVRRAQNYQRDRAHWVASGKPTRPEDQQNQILQICQQCPGGFFRGGTCQHKDCGCPIESGSIVGDKKAWATTRCPIGLWGPDVESLVTACVTSWERPESLARLLRSLERFYPRLRVDVQDTGGNVSEARNELARRCETPYMFLLEEDIELTEQTDLAKWVSVLEHDRDIGAVGGELIFQGGGEERHCWGHNIRVFRGEQTAEPSREEVRVTPDGHPYVPCDLIMNFGLWRTEVARETPWNVKLPIAEHREYFQRLANGRKWRCAVAQVSASHYQDRPHEKYNRARRRANKYRKVAESLLGVTYGPIDKHFEWPSGEHPNILLLTIGYSNSTVTVAQFDELGWEIGPAADDPWNEHPAIRNINQRFYETGYLQDPSRELAAMGPDGWLIKDPRFARVDATKWLPYFAPYKPLLVFVKKDEREVRASFARRGEGHRISEWVANCWRLFEAWPWQKLYLDAEDLIDASEILDRAASQRSETAS